VQFFEGNKTRKKLGVKKKERESGLQLHSNASKVISPLPLLSSFNIKLQLQQQQQSNFILANYSFALVD